MSFVLNEVAPWGRSFDEYLKMFSLSGHDLRSRVLGCGDGPASFNAILTKNGGKAVSVDPLFRFSRDEIRARIDATFPEVMEQTRSNMHEFIWTTISSVEELGALRMSAMEDFLRDYMPGLAQGRYVVGELPHLPFANSAFDLAVCSHLLFLYSGHLSEEFHVDSIRELCRVAGEVRVFPLLELGARPSRHLDSVIARLSMCGYSVDTEVVSYEFQRGGNRMLRIAAGQPG